MSSTEALVEAERLMTICNACRYCEGLCAVFPAMELRRGFSEGDLNYLANLCHGCGACYYDCQFAPPHEFKVNVPQTLAKVRADSYQAYTWPKALSSLFVRNGLVISAITALSVMSFIVIFIALHHPDKLWAIHSGPGAFYQLMPHNTMAALFAVVFVYAVLAMMLAVGGFWRDINTPKVVLKAPGMFWQALKDAGRLRYLDGGGGGCFEQDEHPDKQRKLYHHLSFYGFLLCFAATSVATLYHYLLGREAPYPWYDLPVVLGTLGGIGLLLGPAGLLLIKMRRDPALQNPVHVGFDIAFLAMLFLTSLTGMALLVCRETPAMGLLLALHLGVVFSLFMTLPYGKFVHGFYRLAALLRYTAERY